MTTATAREELPPPLVRFADDPLRWIGIKIELLVAAVTLAHIGMFIVVALYYLLTQKNAAIKNFWDNTLVTNRDLRHSIRDVGEGILGGFLAQAIVWNHFAKSHLKAGRVLRRLHERLHVPEVPLALLASAVFGAIGFCALYYGPWPCRPASRLAVDTPRQSCRWWTRPAKAVLGCGEELPTLRRPLLLHCALGPRPAGRLAGQQLGQLVVELGQADVVSIPLRRQLAGESDRPGVRPARPSVPPRPLPPRRCQLDPQAAHNRVRLGDLLGRSTSGVFGRSRSMVGGVGPGQRGSDRCTGLIQRPREPFGLLLVPGVSLGGPAVPLVQRRPMGADGGLPGVLGCGRCLARTRHRRPQLVGIGS
ncbi:MAG: hypothetical protein M3066_18900 [Actinomycetota bacterium]|nr:hypothetical protein [Actinomycetota bacterium]